MKCFYIRASQAGLTLTKLLLLVVVVVVVVKWLMKCFSARASQVRVWLVG